MGVTNLKTVLAMIPILRLATKCATTAASTRLVIRVSVVVDGKDDAVIEVNKQPIFLLKH